MNLTQELQFVIQSLVANLPILLACLGIFVMAIVRRRETPGPANYVLGAIVLIIFVVLVRSIVTPNLPRLMGSVVPSATLGIAMSIIQLGLNVLYAVGLLTLGAAVFMDRRKW